MRRFTLVALIFLFLLIAGAAVYQLALANRGVERFPGPEVGTPLPSATAAT